MGNSVFWYSCGFKYGSCPLSSGNTFQFPSGCLKPRVVPNLIYSWHLNNKGLNCMGPLICWSFSIKSWSSNPCSKVYLWLGLHIGRGLPVDMHGFLTGKEVSTPNPQVFQGSTVYYKSSLNVMDKFSDYRQNDVCWNQFSHRLIGINKLSFYGIKEVEQNDITQETAVLHGFCSYTS